MTQIEWNPEKAKLNNNKHRVSFEEAATVFYDPLSATFDDLDHSSDEFRMITVGFSSRGRLLVVSHTERQKTSALLALVLQQRMRGTDMKTNPEETPDELRPEYDFDYSKAVRGKYYRQLIEQGSNVIVLDPDLAEFFSDSVSVNEALRSLLDLTQLTQRLTAP